MIRLNILGYKGYFALSNIPKHYYTLIKEIVIARDNKIQRDYFDESAAFCQSQGLNYFERKTETEDNSKYQIVIGWRWLIPAKNKLIIFHDSLLPKYRGFNPLVSALINEEKYIGVTCLYGHDKYDRGEILGQRQQAITYPIKIKSAIEIIANLYSALLNDLLESIEKDRIISEPQNELLATYSLWRDEEDYKIDWSWSSNKIKRFIDAVGFPYFGAQILFNNIILKIYDAEIIEDVKIENRNCGKVIFKDDKGLVIVCGEGLLRISALFQEDGTAFDYSQKFRLRFH